MTGTRAWFFPATRSSIRDRRGLRCPAAVTQDELLIERTINALLNPVRLYSALDFYAQPNPIPVSPGVYAWYFDEIPPGVPIDRCHQALGYTLLYVGIAPKETKGQAVKPSIRTLRHRMRDHFSGNAEGSMLRLLAVRYPKHQAATCGQRKTPHLHQPWRDRSGQMDGAACSRGMDRSRRAVAR